MDLLSQVLELLRRHNFKVEVGKCDFLKREVTYLGHIVTKDGIKPDPSKIKAVQKFLPPKNQKHIRMFLGLCGFYRRFIKNFAHTTKCLSDLLKKDSPFIWTNEHQKAFEMLKQKLCEAPILTYPDIQGEYLLIVDASAKCLGGVLAQGTEKKHNPISYWSRVLTQTEQKYSAYEREALAIYEAVKHFRQYLYASRFIILSDHKPLLSMAEAENNARVQRWRLKLQGYDYTIKHIVGKSNVIADSLSRLPTEICCTKLCKQKRMIKNKIIYAMKRKPGRPRKTKLPPKTNLEETNDEIQVPKTITRRGRPRKIVTAPPETNPITAPKKRGRPRKTPEFYSPQEENKTRERQAGPGNEENFTHEMREKERKSSKNLGKPRKLTTIRKKAKQSRNRDAQERL